MITNANEIRLVIHVENGLIHAVYSNSSTPIRFVIQDFDVEGADLDEMAELADGTEFVVSIQSTVEDINRVANAFMAFDKETPAIDRPQENYIANNGQLCPNCGGGNIEANVALEADGLAAWGRVGCSDCESTWNDQYRLIGFDNLETTKNEASSEAEVFAHELS